MAKRGLRKPLTRSLRLAAQGGMQRPRGHSEESPGLPLDTGPPSEEGEQEEGRPALSLRAARCLGADFQGCGNPCC